MKYIVSLSGGVSSAVAADRTITRYGRESVTLWIADTNAEHPDLWRFVGDCMKRWGGELVTYKDGRTPLQVTEKRRLIPNSLIAPCTFTLKIEPFVRYLKSFPKPVTVLLGLNWDEQHRMEAPKLRYEAMDGVSIDYPLMWKPYCWDTFAEVRSWGIETPELYKMGFSHNNCGGACVKQGKREWLRLMRVNYPLFATYRDWEKKQREKVGDHAFLKEVRSGETVPLTLEDLEKRGIPTEGEAVQEDLFGCFCSY